MLSKPKENLFHVSADYTAFKYHVQMMAQDITTEDADAAAYAEKKFELYGPQFLALCVEHKCGPE